MYVYSICIFKTTNVTKLTSFLYDFEEKYFSACILLTDQIPLSGCL